MRKGFCAAQLTDDMKGSLCGPTIRRPLSIFAYEVSARVKWQSIDNFCSVIATLLVCHSKYLLPFHLKPFPCTPVVLPLFRPFHFLFFFFFALALGSIISKNLWCSTHKGKLENPEWGQAQKIKTKIRSNKRSSRLSRTFVIYYSPKFWPKRKNCKTNSF